PERRVLVLFDRDAVDAQQSLVVADAEAPDEVRALVVEVERAGALAVHVQIAVAAGVVAPSRVVEVCPLREPILAPELRVPVVERVRDNVVVAQLVLSSRGAAQLGLTRARCALLI